MHSHYTNKLLNIEDVIIKKINHADTFVKIYLETRPHEQTCPCCGATTKRIHDYRYQTMKDLPFQLKHAFKHPHITNGPTEGFNNKIKVLKRTSYGIRNFQRLRTRIFLATNI